MSGLFGTLGVMARSLQTQQQSIAIAGQNIANANNPAYARQRVIIKSSEPVPSPIGPIGTGAEAVSIQQIRNQLIDVQIQTETSAQSYWEAQQQALQFAQANLGQEIDRTAGASSSGTQTGLAQSLADLFNAFQSLSTNPSSMAERQVLLMKAQNLTSQFNQVMQRLDSLRVTLNDQIDSDVTNANQLLSDIAQLNDQIVTSELRGAGAANDLRDLRQQKIEELSKLVGVDTVQQTNGGINVSIAGELMVSDKNVLDTLETYDAGSGQMLVRTATGGSALTLTGGSIAAAIDTRDGALLELSTNLDDLAALLITEVNTVHKAGYSLTGSTDADFFTGADAHDIAVNAALLADPSLVQASGTNGATGDNQVALALAQLAQNSYTGLGNQTFSQRFSQTVAGLGQSLSTANNQLSTEQAVNAMLSQQRASISGVSIDEEMTNLTTYQRAFEASAHVISVVDELLQTLINLR